MAVDPRLAIRPEPRVLRFGATERRLHAIHAAAFALLLASGLVLYLPFLAQVVSDRPLIKAIHLVTAVAWLTALALVAVLGDRAALRATRREIERLDGDDLRFLRRRPARAGRFNGGQKAHAIAEAGLAVLFSVSGALLWLGERNTDLRLPGTLALHDAATILLAVLVTGHVIMAFAQPASLEGIWRGTVPARYAADHHPRWRPRPAPAATGGRPAAGRLALAGAIALLGLAAALAVARDVLG